MKKSALMITFLGCLLLSYGCVNKNNITELEHQLQECLEESEAQRKEAEAQRKIAMEQREFAVLTADSLAYALEKCR